MIDDFDHSLHVDLGVFPGGVGWQRWTQNLYLPPRSVLRARFVRFASSVLAVNVAAKGIR